MSLPKTADVLSLIGRRGVVVGSVAAGAEWSKDVDVVISVRGESGKNPVYQDLLGKWRPYADSSAPGHLWIEADPLGVEIFESLCWSVDDPVKRAGQMTYRQARRRAHERIVFGVNMLAAVK